ncbi:MAG: hypothetical protein AAF417_06455 [Pseudomonadota bacterium]
MTLPVAMMSMPAPFVMPVAVPIVIPPLFPIVVAVPTGIETPMPQLLIPKIAALTGRVAVSMVPTLA